MTIIQQFSRQLEQEAQATRKMLAIVPNDKYDWKPHEKSMTIKRLATHIAELPSWIKMTLTTDELDFAHNPYQVENVNNTGDLLDYFERNLEEGRAYLKEEYADKLDEDWTLRSGDTIYSVEPKIDVLRMSLSQIIHHRAQLGVYLRLLDIPIPGSYGPSADESF
ncbi:DinB family protein [Emticicia sp. BO119]|uniref:DinB family protein n=1 Tax=Emticicia sp. BO119 TaxID=2757768 RepID=UPI0015F09096|nr:DinB family protein [Emticicia sp. BO119]MBA4852849.1 DinB family protein [Emticicia sp. BO119]